MARPGKDHGDAMVVGGLDHLVVAHGAAGLDHGGRARLDRGQKAGMAVLVVFFAAGALILGRVKV